MALQLDLSLKQQLKLSPQLIQSFALMTLPLTELQMKIQSAIDTNPTLELPEGRHASLDDGASWDAKRDRDDYSESGPADGEASDRHRMFIENVLCSRETLSEHLLGQIGCMPLTEAEKAAAKTLITSLDANGFYPRDPEEIVREEQKAYLAKLVPLIRGLDPVGVGVRNWRESLMVQAKEKRLNDEELSLLQAMIAHELPALRAGKIEQVARKLGTEREEVEALFAFLRTLTPFPGRDYSAEMEAYVVPDLFIRKEKGTLVMRLNDSALPPLSIDPLYEEMAASMQKGKDREYLQQQLKEARFLISQIEMRNQTLAKVGRVLMIEQREFFLRGPKYLKPLTRREVADMVGVHETTISRVSTAKWIDTDWGIMPLSKLFSNAVGDGEQSKNSVKEMVREIIEGNTSGKALSDRQISDMLAERGVRIARRTVAKYRGELNIDSSFVRGPEA